MKIFTTTGIKMDFNDYDPNDSEEQLYNKLSTLINNLTNKQIIVNESQNKIFIRSSLTKVGIDSINLSELPLDKIEVKWYDRLFKTKKFKKLLSRYENYIFSIKSALKPTGFKTCSITKV